MTLSRDKANRKFAVGDNRKSEIIPRMGPRAIGNNDIFSDSYLHLWSTFCIMVQGKDTALWWSDVLFGCAKAHGRHFVARSFSRFSLLYAEVLTAETSNT